jgi:hypothetical protein
MVFFPDMLVKYVSIDGVSQAFLSLKRKKCLLFKHEKNNQTLSND